eukprot:TRINITY_DN268_c1_g1_i1.p1 TRINITY_DN268_c1_g1~~TRINITY_DN268_c1_g1_i1.p1  ORF type:complete len:296 (+),score=24.76 TRINITY_DN268_c1_g1_i1:1296-2183(+)
MSSVVHDIRTPLNGILGMLDVINQYELHEDIRKFFHVVRSSAKMLLFLTYDITDYSQIEAGVLTVSKAYFAPAEAVNECVQLLEFNFRRKGIGLTTVYSDSIPPRILSDKNRFMQIILNLLGNALKFTFAGGVKVALTYSNSEDTLVASVQDTGIGIKEEDIPTLFKLFGKIKESTEHNPTGVGLGLTICKKLTERLGGKIHVKSVHGSGSKFTFTIKCNLEETKSPGNFATACLDEETMGVPATATRKHTFSNLIHPSPLVPSQVIQYLLLLLYIGNANCQKMRMFKAFASGRQ